MVFSRRLILQGSSARLTVDGDAGLGADEGAVATARAFPGLGQGGRVKAPAVDLSREANRLGTAEAHAKVAALASFFVNLDLWHSIWPRKGAL